jgi:hypothetical protein
MFSRQMSTNKSIHKNMLEQAHNLIEPYIAQLGLSWHVDLRFAQVDRPQITVDPSRQVHHIDMPFAHAQMMDQFRCDYVHELVHGYFAEKIDPIFATTYFARDYDTNDPDFTKKAWMVSWSQQLVDIWVGDKMATLDKKLVREDVSTWLDATLSLPDQDLRELQIETVLGYALNHAQIIRQNLREFGRKNERVGSRIRQLFGKDTLRVANALGDLYTNLPVLPMDSTEAIPLFETKTREAAQLLGFPVNPTIVQDGDLRVWKY